MVISGKAGWQIQHNAPKKGEMGEILFLARDIVCTYSAHKREMADRKGSFVSYLKKILDGWLSLPDQGLLVLYE